MPASVAQAYAKTNYGSDMAPEFASSLFEVCSIGEGGRIPDQAPA